MEGGYYVEYKDQNTKAPEFSLSKKNYGLTTSIEVTDIIYKGDVLKGNIQYGEIENGNVNLWKTGSESITIEKSGMYRVRVTDAAGNTAEKDIEVTICNKPEIVNGMTPIVYNETTKAWDTVTETSGIWYDYSEDKVMWANIKTVSKTANQDGTHNEAYWVWIPRYAYQVPEKPTSANSTGNPPEFKIAFLKGATNIPVNESDLNGKKIKTAEEVADTGPSVGDWVVHPAFTFGDKELTGIWVAKYEASSNTPSITDGGGDTTNLYVNVKPNVSSWRGISVSNMFTVCRNMTLSQGVLEGMNSVDSHMMKNIEWGAVVYLSQSKYGKNSQVWNNPNSSYKTGQAGTGADDFDKEETDNYNIGNGPKASTTGNVYGIYDMAGGSHEYVAAYVDNSYIKTDENIREYNKNIINADIKYKDVYKDGTSINKSDSEQDNYTANVNIYGDAVYETSYKGSNSPTSSWQNDYSTYPYQQYPVFERGGNWVMRNYMGVFYFGWGNGKTGRSFRPVMVL